VKCGYIGDKQRWTSVLKLELGDPAFPAVAAPIRKTAETITGDVGTREEIAQVEVQLRGC
jgi:hypothetical protein